MANFPPQQQSSGGGTVEVDNATGGPLDVADAALLTELQQKLEAGDISALALDATLQSVRDRLPALASGRLPTENVFGPDAKTTGTFTGVNQTLVLPVPQGSNQAMLYVGGGYGAGTVTTQLEVSFDDQASWVPLVGGIGSVTGVQQAFVNSNIQFLEAAVPAVATHLRARVSVYSTGGTVLPVLGVGQGAYEPAPTVSISGTPAVVANGNQMGFVRAAGIWYQDTATAMAANGSITGGVRDLLGTAAGTAFASTSVFPKSALVFCVSDVAGTINIEVSADNITWHRYDAAPLTQRIAGGLFVASYTHVPGPRYLRVNITNGPAAQSKLLLTTTMMGA